MRLSLLLIISSLLLCGCLRPDKPVLEICTVDIPDKVNFCGKTNEQTVEEKPLEYADKGTLLIPKEWKKYQDYVHKLEAYADHLEDQR